MFLVLTFSQGPWDVFVSYRQGVILSRKNTMLRYKTVPQRRLYVNTELAEVEAIAPKTMAEKGLLANASIPSSQLIPPSHSTMFSHQLLEGHRNFAQLHRFLSCLKHHNKVLASEKNKICTTLAEILIKIITFFFSLLCVWAIHYLQSPLLLWGNWKANILIYHVSVIQW